MTEGKILECDSCESRIVLVKVPPGSFQLQCGCELRSVDIDDKIAESNLFNPFSGDWSNIDD